MNASASDTEGMMFELNAVEAVVVAFWGAGIAAALVAGPRQKNRSRRLDLLVVAVAVPVVGSVVALWVATGLRREQDPAERRTHQPTAGSGS